MRFIPLVYACIILFLLAGVAYASEPTSTNYALQEYSIGAGGTASSSSTDYNLNGVAGEVEFGQPSSTNYKTGTGLSYMMMSNVPPAPSFTNPGNYYNKLDLDISTGNNPSDTEFSIMVTGTSTQYVQADDALGSNPVWQTDSQWGSSGFTLIGLTPNITYSASVSAKQGSFTQSPYGPPASASTIDPTFSFSISPGSISNWSLTPNSVGTSPSVTVSMSTNANTGGTIYVKDSNSGLTSSSQGHTISSVTNDLTAINEGYGAQETSVSQTSGGPMEEDSPYNTSGNSVGILSSTDRIFFDSSSQPVTSGDGTFTLLAKPSTTAPPASDYSDTLTIIGSADF